MAWGIVMTAITLVGMLGLVILKISLENRVSGRDGGALASMAVKPLRAAAA